MIAAARFVGRGRICSFVLHDTYFLLIFFSVTQELWRLNKFYLGQFSSFIQKFHLCFLTLEQQNILSQGLREAEHFFELFCIQRKHLVGQCVLLPCTWPSCLNDSKVFLPSSPFCTHFLSQCPIKVYKSIMAYNYFWNMSQLTSDM